MSRTSKIQQTENTSGVGTLPGATIDDACRLLRQELEALRSNRIVLRDSRSKEIEMLECQLRNANEELQRNLSEYTTTKIYRRFLMYYQRNYRDGDGDGDGDGDDTSNASIGGSYKRRGHGTRYAIPDSNYIVRQETPLLSAIHRWCCVLPHQIEYLKGRHGRVMYPYFRNAIRVLRLELREVSDDWMGRLSDQAQENIDLYDSHRAELESIEMEVKRYRAIVMLQQREAATTTTSGKETENIFDCDESTFLSSDTEGSFDSDDELSSRGENSFSFLKEALNLFTASPILTK